MNELLLISLNTYYSKNGNIEYISNIINGTSTISLRLIDWYVTNHCKNNNVVYIMNNNEYFNVYLNYRSQLKAFKKVQFDPFRRRERISYYMGNEPPLFTTIGQLNFFRWAIENKIIENINKDLSDLENRMVISQRPIDHGTMLSSNDIDKNISSIKKMTTYKGKTNISFK